MPNWDVVVVGAGNAAFSAALSAQENGASVLMLERAPKDEDGGNSRFTAGAIRFAYRGLDDLRAVMPDLSADEIATTDFGSYDESQFFDDMFRVTNFRTDPDLCETLVTKSFETMRWFQELGIRFVPIYGRQAFKSNGRFKFWGGLTVEAWGGGPGLVDRQTEIAGKRGIEIRYATRAVSLIYDGDAVRGVRVKHNGAYEDIHAKSVVLACGGFQSNTEWRSRYLGAGWELAKVRGTRFNTGDGIRMAIDIGASTSGNWSGCHAVGWDFNAPEFGDLAVGDGFQKHSYPFGIMVNAKGERFVDEGLDFRNYTYAKYGRAILEQPGQLAWQIFDSKVVHLLRDEYRTRNVTKVTANTLEELCAKLEGVDQANALKEINKYNESVDTVTKFDANIKDGKSTSGLPVNKTNWANRIDEGPFEAYQVGCGITFTFGGLRVDPKNMQVMDTDLNPIPGLYTAGEMMGGLFFFNYPGGTGLMSGAVFGRLAGHSAAKPGE
ncbi:FAD-dependent tricarballylate dehydrogenase TcuA [Hoeflea algicola]|uniref:FAD-dependent tricarballylate dehydrogenase TcuA n=1 Tax=Hoeflea algicola TaxID=2983763 RepID=UPI003CE4C6D8